MCITLRILEKIINFIADFIYSFKSVLNCQFKAIPNVYRPLCIATPLLCTSHYVQNFKLLSENYLPFLPSTFEKILLKHTKKFTIILVLIISTQKITLENKLNHISLIYDGKNYLIVFGRNLEIQVIVTSATL